MDDRVLERDEWTLSIDECRSREVLLSKYTLGAVLTSPSVLAAIRHELSRIDTTVSIDLSEIKSTLVRDIVLPDVFQHRQNETIRTGMNRPLTHSGKRERRDALQLTTSDPDSVNIAGDP